LDASATHLNPPPPSTGTVFSLFFVLAGAQCREQQHVPLNFTKFMDGQELCKAIIREVSSEGPLRIMICIKGGFCCSITTMEQQNLM
jgi:hypothetical protein